MLQTGQVAVTTTPQVLCTLPRGRGMVTVSSDPASADTAYVGVTPSSGTFTAADGVPLGPGGRISFEVFETFEGASLSVACATGTATVGFVVSSYND